MKLIFSSPFEDSDSEPEEVEVSSGSEEDGDGDVSMRSLVRAYDQEEMDTSEEDEDYVESGSSDSEDRGSDSSVATSVSTNPKSEVSECAVSEDEQIDEDEVKGLQEELASGNPRTTPYGLIFREINEDQLNQNLPTTCELVVEDPNQLQKLQFRISPDNGYWHGGIFTFDVTIPEGYNSVPPEVKCTSKVFHPNIAEDGTIGLTLLRQMEMEGAGDSNIGWNSNRQLKDVVLGINSLFTNEVNTQGALNAEAAKLFEENKEEFAKRVLDTIRDRGH